MTPASLPDAIRIRPLGAGDSLDELTDLLHRAYARLAQMDLRFMATHQSVDVTRSRVTQGECFVAVAGERIIGTVVFRTQTQTRGCPWYDRADVASFGQLAVDPAQQSAGVGRRLVDHVETRAIASGAAEIALDTAEPATHLVQWYSSLGYRLVETAQWRHTNYRSVIMSKPLAV